MYPVCKRLEQKKWPRSLAVTACLLIVFVLFAVLIWLLVLQVKTLQSDLPELKQRIEPSIKDFQVWIENNIGITINKQDSWFAQQANSGGNSVAWLEKTLSSTVNSLFILFLVPVFAALFLYNRRTFVRFLQLAVGEANRQRLDATLEKTIDTYFNYIKGMVMVYIIVGTLNSAGLLLIGVKHAVLFGYLTAIMTIIPYIGIIVSALLPISVAWIETGSVWAPLGVVAVFAFVQYLEANVIFPKVVGAQLNVNTWSMLVFILAGGIIWGVSGMILFIPFAGMLKIVTDDAPGWSSVNVLLSRPGKQKKK
jgi:predicted PurR-regulated permease PerM